MPEFIADPATMAEYMACVEAFLAEDYLRPPGLDTYEDCFNSPWFFPLQRRHEMARMIQIARSINPTVVMEIGADKGAGIFHWCKCLSTIRIMIACEIRGCPYQTVMAKAFPHISFAWMERSSRPPPTISWPIDVLFIDGDKCGFEQDFDAYLPLMNPKGIVFMHDIHPGGDRQPREAFERIKARGYRTDEIVDLNEVDETMERARQGIPPVSAHEGWLRHWQKRSAGVGVIWLDKKG